MSSKGVAKRTLNLIIGLGFLGYGSYKLFTFFYGADYSTFRLLIFIGFIVLGAVDLYKFFRSRKKNGKPDS